MLFNVLRDPYKIGQLKLDFTMEIAIFLLSNWIHRENDTKEIASSCISYPRRVRAPRGMKNWRSKQLGRIRFEQLSNCHELESKLR